MLLFLSDALESFLPLDQQGYSDALEAITLDVEEACLEPEPHAVETVYEVPYGLDPVRLCKKAKRRVSKGDINQGLFVDVGYCKMRNAVVCKVSPRQRFAPPGAFGSLLPKMKQASECTASAIPNLANKVAIVTGADAAARAPWSDRVDGLHHYSPSDPPKCASSHVVHVSASGHTSAASEGIVSDKIDDWSGMSHFTPANIGFRRLSIAAWGRNASMFIETRGGHVDVDQRSYHSSHTPVFCVTPRLPGPPQASLPLATCTTSTPLASAGSLAR
ncbi:hypothetical protein BDK51DRAFT_36691 [Blyttiomyces helicus]|uniref:Uncharacterized protein n=1 Tax=Blyttiomyces helicus TaxID=388810 RepID=A0A4V1IRC0_9FUNG|nr:hypothetical protein BDK51DRAFT_36691 [Blyttiomyces helicus]|eukprot:RKO89527.1 hypothetical protein BDK51DRAFT_36691 [Blyttiomyces helicus]